MTPETPEMGGVSLERDGITAPARVGGRRRREERPVPAESYYGRPIVKKPVWEPLDIAGYLFLGGLSGASATLAAGADLTGRRSLSKAAKAASTVAAGLSMVALVHDLGVPSRFPNMLRVFKPTSPMSVGSWLLAAFVPATAVATLSTWTGRWLVAGRVATAGAAFLGPAVASYTGVLIADTAVPAWHEGHREMPVVFVGSAASAAGGWGLLAAPLAESGPARRAAVAGATVELVAFSRMRKGMGSVARAYDEGRPGRLRHISEALTAAGALGAIASRRSRAASMVAGGLLLAGSACTRFAIFDAGVASAQDPAYTVGPQRERLEAQRDRLEAQGDEAPVT